jgi:HPt (histidine-containing phosphotransfer) domain-containing protein
MEKPAEIPNFDPYAFNSLMKMGGKKKLDALIGLLKESAPARMAELKAAPSLSEAQAAARALKTSAGNLGLARLEDFCDQVLVLKAWDAGNGLIPQMDASLRQGLAALLAQRAKI